MSSMEMQLHGLDPFSSEAISEIVEVGCYRGMEFASWPLRKPAVVGAAQAPLDYAIVDWPRMPVINRPALVTGVNPRQAGQLYDPASLDPVSLLIAHEQAQLQTVEMRLGMLAVTTTGGESALDKRERGKLALDSYESGVEGVINICHAYTIPTAVLIAPSDQTASLHFPYMLPNDYALERLQQTIATARPH